MFQFEFLKKAILYLSAINFIYCCVNSKFNKVVFHFASFLSAVFIIFSFSLFLLGPARKWYGYSSWNNLTLNFSNPNLAGLILFYQILMLLISISAYNSKILKTLFFICLALGSFLLYFTSCRTVLLAFVIGIVVTFINSRTKNKKTLSLFVALFPILFAFTYLFVCNMIQKATSIDLQIYSYAGVTFGKALSSRITIWLLGLKFVLQNPFGGNYLESYTGHYHNSLVDAWATYGVFVFLLIVFVIAFMCLFAFRKKIGFTKHLTLLCLISSVLTMTTETTILQASLGTYVIALVFLPLMNCEFEPVHELFRINNKHRCDSIIVSNVYSLGSIGKLVQSISEYAIEKGCNNVVLFGRGNNNCSNKTNAYKFCTEFEACVSKAISHFTRKLYSYNLFATYNLIKFIKKEKPKVVNIHSINDYYINPYLLLRFLKKEGIKTVITAHAGNLLFANCGGNSFECTKWKRNPGCVDCPIRKNKVSQKLWLQTNSVFKDFNNLTITTVSEFLCKQFAMSPYFMNKRIITIHDSVSDSFTYKNNFIIKELSNKKNILLVIPKITNPNKGFNHFVELAKRMPNLNFVCVSMDEEKPNERLKNMFFFGPYYNDLDLANIYSFCDLTLVLSKSETYCMPVAESLCCGTRVVGFKSGGPEEISIKEYSAFVEYGDLDSIENKINCFLSLPSNKTVISSAAREKYCKSKMNQAYFALLQTPAYYEVDI